MLHQPADERAAIAALVERARELLGPDDFSSAWSAGAALSAEQAIAEGLIESATPDASSVVRRRVILVVST
jgi:hypothetical protein